MVGRLAPPVQEADAVLFDKTTPIVWLGDMYSATNDRFLTEKAIRRVAVCAEELADVAKELDGKIGKKRARLMAETNEEYERGLENKIVFYPLVDSRKQDLTEYIEPFCQFIDRSLECKTPTLVHCAVGRSRSASLILAYLITRYGLTYPRALKYIQKFRDVLPNSGFARQLKGLRPSKRVGDRKRRRE